MKGEIKARPAGAYLSKLLSLLLPLCTILIVLLDSAQQEVDLGHDNFRERVRAGRAVRAGTRASAECAAVVRGVG